MKHIKILVMDVDGTLTDGKIYMGPTGEVFKRFDIKDGYGIYTLLKKNDIVPIIITGRQSEIVLNRCRELGIGAVYQGILDKKTKLLELIDEYNLQLDDTGKIIGCAYIGDDLIDLPPMKISEYAACPSDAVAEVRNNCDYVCKSRGGEGAVREFIEWLLDY